MKKKAGINSSPGRPSQSPIHQKGYSITLSFIIQALSVYYNRAQNWCTFVAAVFTPCTSIFIGVLYSFGINKAESTTRSSPTPIFLLNINTKINTPPCICIRVYYLRERPPANPRLNYVFVRRTPRHILPIRIILIDRRDMTHYRQFTECEFDAIYCTPPIILGAHGTKHTYLLADPTSISNPLFYVYVRI